VQLTDDDFRTLESCYISREIAEKAGLVRVDSLEGRDRVGRKGPGNYAGILYPYRDPLSGQVVAERLRLDSPPVDAATGKPAQKYVNAPGQRNHFYCPLAERAWFGDRTIPILIVEGEKKGLASHRAAVEAGNGTTGAAFFALAFAGVYSFRGVIGITTDRDGLRIPLKGIIPDLDKIQWKGRKVWIAYDFNVRTNDMVRAARATLARELEHRGAQVWFVELPDMAGVNGPDDYLAQAGLKAFLNLLEHAYRWDWRNSLIKSDKGKILPLTANALTALREAPEWHGVVGFNRFALRAEALRPPPWNGGERGSWSDESDLLTTEWMERHGICISDSRISKAVLTVAHENDFHPVHEYLGKLVWDKVDRVSDWLTPYCGVDPSDYTRAVGVCWLISAVARIFEPGCKADHALVLEGPQGLGKSTVFQILGGEFYSDDIADLGTKDAALGTTGAWIIELAELAAMGRTEIEKIKSFISRTTDRFRPPYGRHLIEVSRACVFAGSVNLNRYLKDETGGRRFWPVVCGNVLNLAALRRDRDQLWAEAVVRYNQKQRWWLDQMSLIQAASLEQEDRYQSDPWESLIERWLLGHDECTTADVLIQAVQKVSGQWTRADEIRVGLILGRLGWAVAGRAVGTRKRIYREKTQA